MTADPIAYPEMLDPAGSLELRSVKALERIATALEQLVLEKMPEPKSVLERIAAAPHMGDLPPDQLPPPPAGPSPEFLASRDLPAQPIVPQFQPMQPNWQAGMVHQNGHKPLKINARGLYCPTKMDNGEWCKWHA